jgi:ABC-type amino acid transport substrate-binding protein
MPAAPNKRRPWRAAAIAAWLYAALAPAQAAPPLNFGVINAAPYGEVDAAKHASGIYPRFLASLAKDLGQPIEPVVLPFARAAHLTSIGALDGTIMFKNATTDGKTVALAPLYITGQIVQAAPGIRLRSRGDLDKLLVGRIRGGCQDLEQERGKDWRFYELNNQQQGVEMLLAQRIGAFCTAPEALSAAIAQFDTGHKIDAAERLTISEKPVWVLVRADMDPALRRRLRASVLRVRDGGELAAIFHEVLGARYKLRLPPH